VDAIHTNERVLALSTNPLLCTIIAVVFRNNRVLPDRRVELYFKCCEALLDTWERNKDIRNSGLIGNFGLQQKLELLATLAHWMHSKAERLAAPEEEIVRRIAEALKAEYQSDPGRAEGEARRFVEAIRDRSGLLRGRGDGSLEFSHRTFQEYLAARHIAALDEEPMIDAVMPDLHKAWWREAHLLLFGKLGSGKGGSSKVERLACCIIGASGKPLPFLEPPASLIVRPFSLRRLSPGWQLQQRVARLLGRDLIFAIRGYGQCVTTARSASLTKRLLREIDGLLLRLRNGSLDIEYVIGEFVPYGGNDPVGTAVTAALLAALKDDDQNVRSAAAEALGGVAAGDPAVTAALVAALKDDDYDVRSAAAGTLGGAAAGDPAVTAALVAALLAALKDDDRGVRWAAARALSSAPSADRKLFRKTLAALFQNFERTGHFFDEIVRLTESRQLPGYRWRSLQGRRKRKERLYKLLKATGTGLAIGVVLYFGGQYYADLPETSPMKAFLKAIPAVSGLLGLAWGLVLVLRGEKRTLWG